MTFQIETATRSKAKLRIGIAGPSGSGKTYSALKLAYGLTGNWNTIGVIDTEQRSASLYSHLGEYKVIPFDPPYSPTRYIEAIKLFESSGIEVIVIDSMTHEWQGSGGVLEMHEAETNRMRVPNSFTAWAKITPLHNQFIDAILRSPAHIIATVRSKQDYVLVERNGKKVPEKVGMASIQRDGIEYEFTLNFTLNQDHQAFADKDRTSLFMKEGELPAPFNITETTGKSLKEWAETGRDVDANGDPLMTEDQKKKIFVLGGALGYDKSQTESKVLEYYKVHDFQKITQKKADGMIKALMEKIKVKEAQESSKPLSEEESEKLAQEASDNLPWEENKEGRQ